MAQAKGRADELVHAQGLAESREQAKRLIMAGKVALAPEPVPTEQAEPSLANLSPAGQSGRPFVRVDKPGHRYSPDTRFMLVGVERFVSRGAYKLLTALTHFNLDVRGLVCLDAGASTGGFTEDRKSVV